MKNFKPSEFSEPIKHASPELLDKLDQLRDFINRPIYPSPLPGALARFDDGQKTSQHYAVGRKSTATDVFIDCEPFEALIKICRSNLFPRIGIYFDTFFRHRKWVMFHFDLFEKDLMWFRNDGGYTYSTHHRFYHNLFKFLFLNLES
jgi:hypothetical protein